MKALKWVLIVLGAVCLGFGLYMVIRLSVDVKTVVTAANSGRGADMLASPMPTVWVVAGIALAAGALLGLGLGLPRRTSGSVRRDALEDAAAQREQAIRENALRRAAAPSVAAQAGSKELSTGAGEHEDRPQLEQRDPAAKDQDEDTEEAVSRDEGKRG